jgi:3-hydroxyisobutyrate dehydrogenase-like beta-hydroxyacid dehydrogenase
MRIGFIGLGTMGGPMASNLMQAGHSLVVNDVRRAAGDRFVEQGARWADSPAEAAREAELTLTSLPGPKEVEQVALGEQGIIHGAARDAVYADLSTSSPTLIRRIHGVFAERGVHVLDAPVSGGPHGARAGTLQIMVGGDEAIFERARPAFEAIGENVTYIGDIGCGEIAKLVHNMVSYCAGLALAEGFTLGVKAGVKPEKLLEAIRGAAYGRGYMLSYRLPEVIFKGAYDNVGFALKLARKDVGLATELAREFNVPMEVASLAEQNLIQALVRGWGDKDSSAVFMLQEERAGVKVRTS